MPIEIESPEGLGYEKIECNLSESSFMDQKLSDLGFDPENLVLFYGDHKGKKELREHIASEHGLNLDQVLVTPGAATALFIVSTTLLEKGSPLLVARPNYATNLETPRLIGAEISYIELKFENRFELDIEFLTKKIEKKNCLVSLTYPHNPTGVTLKPEQLFRIVELIEKNNCILLIDETYREMSFEERPPPAASLSDRIISISSMSKSFGLPGIRIGWIICKNKYWMESFLAAKEQICITNSVIDEEIALHYLRNKQALLNPVLERIKRNFNLLTEFMNGQKCLDWVPPGGGCVSFPRFREPEKFDMDRFHEILLNDYATYIGKGSWFEMDSRYMRIGYGWEQPQKLSKGLENILKALDRSRID